jgi:hypothetical protein
MWKQDRVPNLPKIVLFRSTLEYAPFDDAIFKYVEANLSMALKRSPLLRRDSSSLLNIMGHISVQPLGMDWIQGILLTLKPITG